MGMIKEFKDFAMKGNVVDLAVAVIIGGAFGAIVTALVDKILMPIIAFVLFMIIKVMNSTKKKEEAAPAATPEDIALLREIRDSLKK